MLLFYVFFFYMYYVISLLYMSFFSSFFARVGEYTHIIQKWLIHQEIVLFMIIKLNSEQVSKNQLNQQFSWTFTLTFGQTNMAPKLFVIRWRVIQSLHHIHKCIFIRTAALFQIPIPYSALCHPVPVALCCLWFLVKYFFSLLESSWQIKIIRLKGYSR